MLGDIERFHFIFCLDPDLHQDGGWMLAVNFCHEICILNKRANFRSVLAITHAKVVKFVILCFKI